MNYFKTITKFIYLTAVLFTLSLQAQAIDYSKLLEPVEVMDSSILDSYKFMYKDSVSGDEVDPATGRLGFSVTDIAIPGNFSIAVALTRKLRTDDTDLGGPAGWTWDNPYIKGYYLKSLVENTD